MAYDSFGDFLAALERAGELVCVPTAVATELEITEWSDREMKSAGGGKALFFEKPTVNGITSPFPVAINTMGSHRRMAMALGLDHVDELMRRNGIDPESQAAHFCPARLDAGQARAGASQR
jgi:4-hydroxy-3-polyprenylbenzoate decarboxylase